jgi:hypothetical protein
VTVNLAEIRQGLDRMTTEALLDALHHRADGEWLSEAYELMATILRERGVAVEEALSALEKAQAPDPNAPVQLVPVATAFNPIEAELIRGRLEQAGIRVFVADEGIASMHYGLGIAAGGVKVMVSAQDLSRAQDELAAPAQPVTLECPRCGSEQVAHEERVSKAGVLAAYVFFSAPIPQHRRRCRCNACGNEWQE